MKNLFLLSFFFLFISPESSSQQLEDEAQFTDQAFIPGYTTKKRKNPELFQGNKKTKNYFEGWYFKMVGEDGASILSVIPGISLSENGKEQHAFIQVIDGKTAQTYYYTFPIEDFAFSKKKFAVRIANNYFSEDSLSLNIQQDSTSFVGTVFMSPSTKLTRKNKKLDIMGWYKFAPFMQCYHGVVSLDHTLTGSLRSNTQTYKFDQGKGYIEKDWGKSMPSSWIWIQSNSFSSDNTSFMLSVANVPWMGSSFPGFLGFFLHDSTTTRFGTYSGAKVKLETSNPNKLKIAIIDKEFTYYLEASRSQSGLLKAPVQGAMDRRIAESIDAHLKLTVVNQQGIVLFRDSTSIAGLEIVGDTKELGKSESISMP